MTSGATEVDTASFNVSNSTASTTGTTGTTSTTGTTGTTTTNTTNTTSASKFFAPSSFINTPLPSNPSIDPNSASMVQNSLVAQASAAHLSNGDYGVGLVYSSASDKVYSVACTIYDSNTCLVGSHINFPIPKGAVPPAGTDHNTSFIYTANDGSPYAGMELDCWIAQYNATNDTWSCGTASLVKNNTTNGWGTCAEGNITSYHCNGGYAAGFDYAAGPIRPEEIQAGKITHALVVALSNTGSGITCPATHTDHSGNGIPEGGHFFLPASYNVDAQSWSPWVKTVAKALQQYGGYIVDYGGSFEVKGFSDKNPGSITWSSVGVPVDGWSDLAMIPWDQMQVVTMQSCN